jgi:hypothetical protein
MVIDTDELLVLTMCTGRGQWGVGAGHVPRRKAHADTKKRPAAPIIGNYDALARAIKAARSEKGYKSDQALALAAGVHLQTLQNWMYGKTTPRSLQLFRVAKVLDKPQDYFAAIYEGREPEETPLHEKVAELTGVVRGLVAEIREDRKRGQDAAEALLRAAEVLRSRPTPPAAGASRERPVPDGSRG